MDKKELLEKSKFLLKKSNQIIMTRAEGIYLYDIDGNKYLDMTSSAWTMNLGYGNSEIEKAVNNQMRDICHCRTHYHTIPKLLLAEKISKLSPIKDGKIEFALHGSAANEGALKLAFNYNENNKTVLYLEDGFHGRTFGTMAVSWKHQNEKFSHYYGENIEVKKEKRDAIKKIRKYKPSAFVLELIQGNGGQYVIDKSLIRTIADTCKETNTILIVDEIQTGFGRCGCYFLSEEYKIVPDIITFGKAAGGGLPLFGSISRPGLQHETNDHSFTFAHFPLAMASSLAYLDQLNKNLFKQTIENGEYLQSKIRDVKTELGHLGEPRGVGFMIGVDILDKDGNPDINLAEMIVDKMLEHKIIMNLSKSKGYGFVMKFKPGLIITKIEIDYVLDVFKKVLKDLID